MTYFTVKICINLLALFITLDAITSVFNRCIKEGTFPSIWKRGKVVPVHKRGALNKIENYRPVCLFSNLGKFLELVVRRQFSTHLEQILPDNVYGFRSGRSTQDAVCHVLDSIHEARSKGKYVAILSMDASCAFDIINHDVILKSLEIVGVGPLMRKWSESFLKDCSNFVQIDNAVSESWPVETGSGQGRRLSPDYYNLATMSQAIFATISAFSGYADDGSDVIYGDSIRECNEKLRAVVDQRRAWYRDMGLVLNDKKTEILGINFIPDPITIEDIIILPKSEITFLGVTIQSDLKWSSHIQSLCGKIYAAANRIHTEARHLSITDRRILYFGWVQGYIISNGLAYLPTLNKTEQLSL